MNTETFFKGVEVGRALRGWRTPDTAQNPSGTANISKNGEYDVARYATASVNVEYGPKAKSTNAMDAMEGAFVRFRTLSDCGLSASIQFMSFINDKDGYPSKAVMRTTIGVMNPNFNSPDTHLGYVLPPDEFTIPGQANTALHAVFKRPGSNILSGNHSVTFTQGPSNGDYKLQLKSSALPSIDLFFLLPGLVGYSETAYQVKCSGDAWRSYDDIWVAYYDTEVSL